MNFCTVRITNLKLWNVTLSFTLSLSNIYTYLQTNKKRNPTIKTRKLALYFLYSLSVHHSHSVLHILFTLSCSPSYTSFCAHMYILTTCIVCVVDMQMKRTCDSFCSVFFLLPPTLLRQDLSCFGCCVVVILALPASIILFLPISE